MATSKKSQAQVGLELGFRSGLEASIAEQLDRAGIVVEFETWKVRYQKMPKPSTYMPDFTLPNGIIIETKGRFLTADRQKHKWIKEQHPDLDIRFVFSRAATRISKTSQTSYAQWCYQYGFKWSDKVVPKSWLDAPSEPKRTAAIKRAMK
jgi:hypothetical protein